MKYLILVWALLINLCYGLTTLTVPDTFELENRASWNRVINIIESGKDDILLIWSGDGGRMDLGERFINAIKKAQKLGRKVNFRLKNDVISMHALVVCFGNTLTFESGAKLWFHGASIKYFNEKIYAEPNSRDGKLELYWFSMCVKKKLLTNENVYNIMYRHYLTTVIYTSKGIQRETYQDWPQ